MILNIPDEKTRHRLTKERDEAKQELSSKWQAISPCGGNGKKPDLVELTKEHPYAALGVAAGCGLALTFLLKSRMVRGAIKSVAILGFKSSLPAILASFGAGED